MGSCRRFAHGNTKPRRLTESKYHPKQSCLCNGLPFPLWFAHGTSELQGNQESLITLLAFATSAAAQTPSPALYTLHNFHGPDGACPNGIIGANGLITGTTSGGGANGFGNVFSMTVPTPVGSSPESAFYSFNGGDNGGDTEAGVTKGSQGVLYGTDGSGVFSLTPPSSAGGAWTETQLYTFTGGLDGGEPYLSGIAVGHNGVLYGTTVHGGTFGLGVVFFLTPPAGESWSWTEDVLFNFPFNPNPSTLAACGVVIGSGGVLYGEAFQWSTDEGGAIYSLTRPAATAPRRAAGSWALVRCFRSRCQYPQEAFGLKKFLTASWAPAARRATAPTANQNSRLVQAAYSTEPQLAVGSAATMGRCFP